MKKFFALLAIALLLIPSVSMAADLSADGTIVRKSAQGIFQVYRIRPTIGSGVDQVADGDTFTGPSTPAAYWTEFVSSSSTAIYGHTRESSGTYTFETSGDCDTVYLYVIKTIGN